MQRTHAQRGFTLIEMVIVVAIIAILGGLAFTTLSAARPRQTLSNATAELQALLHGARQQALASSRPVVVAVFPGYAVPRGGTGRIIAFEDRDSSFFLDASAVNLGSYAPAVPASPAGSTQDPALLDLPAGISIGTARAAALPAPLAAVAVTVGCSFCGADRGAIRFDERGRATFYSANGAALAEVTGHSLSLTSAPDLPGYRTLVVVGTSGAVLAFNDQ